MTANVWVCWLTVLIFDTVHSDRALLSNNFPLGLGLNKNNCNYYYYYYTILPPTILNAYYGPENELCVCHTLSYLILTIEVQRGAVISQCHIPTKPRSWHCMNCWTQSWGPWKAAKYMTNAQKQGADYSYLWV